MMKVPPPSYRRLLENEELRRRVETAFSRLASCNICAHRCGIDRLAGEVGFCKTGVRAMVSSYSPHFGEEDPIRGRYGSGTIFFSRCNLRCQFCQNYEISQQDTGEQVDPQDLANFMLDLQDRGCHNINLVSPSHVVPQILAAVLIAAKAGLSIPLVYNTGGYDSIETLALLDGDVDIYMPDMKYANPELAFTYSRIKDYPRVNQIAIKVMHRQVGDLQCDHHGIAYRGLLVRHLVLPNQLAGTAAILKFLAAEISQDTYVNLMDQYHPSYYAHQCPQLNRRITGKEYQEALAMARTVGLTRLDQRRSPLFPI